MKTVKNTHVGCYGVIIDNEKIALIKKACGGYTGKLDLPGGGMEHEESEIETLKREIKEEVGVNVLEYSLLDAYSANITWKVNDKLIEDLHHIGIIYKVKVDSKNLKKTPDGIDSLGANFYPIKDLEKDMLTPFTILSLEKLGYRLGD